MVVEVACTFCPTTASASAAATPLKLRCDGVQVHRQGWPRAYVECHHLLRPHLERLEREHAAARVPGQQHLAASVGQAATAVADASGRSANMGCFCQGAWSA